MLNVYNSTNYKNENVETAYMPIDRGVNREDMVHTYSVIIQFSGSDVSDSATPCCSTPGFPIHHQFLGLTQTHVHESVMPSKHLILSCPLLLLPSIFPSIRVFLNESVLPITWPKYWSFSISISPSNEYSGLISFRIWLDLLAVQGTLNSLLQHHSSKASILQHSAFFIVQLSHPYMATGKTIALTRWTFVGKVISLLFNMMSRLVMALLSRSHSCSHQLQ